MTLAATLLELLMAHPDAGVLVVLGGYVVYEVRFGRVKQLHSVQMDAEKERHLLSVAVYKIIRDDEEFDEQRFRDLIWGNDGEDTLFPQDLEREISKEDC